MWKYYFFVELQKKEKKGPELSVPMGCVSIRLRSGHRSSEYMSIPLSKSNKGWHSLWFYLKNDATDSLPLFTARLIEEAPVHWKWGPTDKEKRRLEDLIEAIKHLKRCGLCGEGIIGDYHVRRLAPLMKRALPMYKMEPDSSPEGTVMVAV